MRTGTIVAYEDLDEDGVFDDATGVTNRLLTLTTEHTRSP